jgi:hypothetical protein
MNILQRQRKLFVTVQYASSEVFNYIEQSPIR